MILSNKLPFNRFNFPPFRYTLCVIIVILAVAALTACGNKEKKTGQALVRVNGEEITMLQINDELVRAAGNAEEPAATTRQLLETLIDRHLITIEAVRNKFDRTPEVMQAINRAKSEILAQAYLESIAAKVTRPTQVEINEYFQKHPEYFTQRKQFDLQQLVISTGDLNDELKLIIDSAKSLDSVAAWLDSHNVRYARNQLSRNSIDLPEQIVPKLKEMQKGQLFIVNKGENSLLNAITDVKDSPVTVAIAAPQIEQYLVNKKSREMADAEIAHLRSLAKIEYLNEPAQAASREGLSDKNEK